MYTLPIAHITQFHNRRTALSLTASQSRRSFFEHRSLNFPFVTLNNKHFTFFSPGTFHSPVSTLTLTLRTHTTTTVHTAQSHNYSNALTKISVCVCLKNINIKSRQHVGVVYIMYYGFISEFEHLYFITWFEKQLVNNYTFLNFHRNYLLVFGVKLV